MVLVIASMFRRCTGAEFPKLYCPQMPHMRFCLVYRFGLKQLKRIGAGVAGLTRVPRKQKSETAKQLRLRPAVHWHIVPARQQLPRAERAIGLLPALQHIPDDSRNDGVQL